jgi:hypothetical protein
MLNVLKTDERLSNSRMETMVSAAEKQKCLIKM